VCEEDDEERENVPLFLGFNEEEEKKKQKKKITRQHQTREHVVPHTR